MRVAWTLEWLFCDDGYAFPGDTYLSRKLDIPINKIQSCLTDLERGGAIIRASVFVNGKPERHIWPSSKIIEVHTPRNRGTEYLRKAPPRQNRRLTTTTQDAARRDAELREQIALKRGTQQ